MQVPLKETSSRPSPVAWAACCWSVSYMVRHGGTGRAWHFGHSSENWGCHVQGCTMHTRSSVRVRHQQTSTANGSKAHARIGQKQRQR